MFLLSHVTLTGRAGPLLGDYMLDNTHRVSLELLPDSQLAAQQAAAEAARLQVRCGAAPVCMM